MGKISWAELAAHHWVLSNTLTQSASVYSKTAEHRKEVLKDAKAHRELAERLGDVAYQEGVKLLQAYSAGTLDEDEGEEEEEEDPEAATDAPPVEEIDGNASGAPLPKRVRPGR